MLETYHIQITGPSGSGKSYFAKALREMGYPVEDGDHIEGLGYFINNETKEAVEYNHEGGLDWFKSNTYIWNKEVLEKYLSENPRMIICGGASNQDETAKLFDQVFYFNVPKQDILNNLRANDRENEYGRTDVHQEFASKGIDMFYNDIPKGWKPITSREPKVMLAEVETYLGDKLEK